MTRRIAFYFADTGEIKGVDDYADDFEDDDIDAEAPDGTVWLETDADMDNEYLPGGVRTPRPDIGAEDVYHVDADGVERTLFTMPDPTVVTYRGVEYIAGGVYLDIGDGYVLGVGDDYLVVSTDSDLDFNFKASRNGEFEFLIDPVFPYKPTTVLVIADAV